MIQRSKFLYIYIYTYTHAYYVQMKNGFEVSYT